MNYPFNPNNTKSVFFDMTNTLIDASASFDRCFTNVLTDFAGRWDDGAAAGDKESATGSFPGGILHAYKKEWEKWKSQRRRKPGETEKGKRKCLEIALRDYPFQVNDAFAAAFFREMSRQVSEYAVLLPHAADIVGKLASDYRLGIITNGSKERQRKTLNRLGLSAHIEDTYIFASDQHGGRKPQPAIFRTALRQTGVRPGEAVMIGDSWKNDCVGALACGMKAVWLNRAKEGATIRASRQAGGKKVPIVRSLQQLVDLFELQQGSKP